MLTLPAGRRHYVAGTYQVAVTKLTAAGWLFGKLSVAMVRRTMFTGQFDEKSILLPSAWRRSFVPKSA
jgi:hypothetical protein